MGVDNFSKFHSSDIQSSLILVHVSSITCFHHNHALVVSHEVSGKESKHNSLGQFRENKHPYHMALLFNPNRVRDVF